VDRVLADKRPRALGERGAFLANLTPGEWAEEADRVVLGAVALPIASDDFLALAPFARLAAFFEEAVDHRERPAVLPSQRFAKGQVGGNLAQVGRFAVRAEGVESGDREAGAADREVAAKCPIPGERNEVVLHGRRP
jgi:hypothetical protein